MTSTSGTGAMRGLPAPGINVVTSAKIVVAGGFGVGKTTFVGAVSETTPLTTEAAMTSVGTGIDDPSLVPGKGTITVAMDFGRTTLDAGHAMDLRDR